MNKKIFSTIFIILIMALSAAAEHPRDMKFPPLEFKPPKPIRYGTDNGLIVYFFEDHQLPVMTGSLIFHGGTAYDSAEKAGLASVSATLLRSGGAGLRAPEQVDADLDYVGASISSRANADNLQLNFKCLKKDIDITLEILSDMIINPQFDSSKMALELSNMQDRIRRQNDDPGAVTRRIFYEIMYTGHPYGLSPTLESTGNISRENLIAQHQRHYAPNNCIVAVSGDLSFDEFKQLMDKYFSSWNKSNITIENLPNASMKYTPGIFYAKRDINQAHIRFGNLTMNSKNPDQYAFEIMNFALGGGGFTSRLMNQVRTSAGLAYSVGAYQLLRPFMGTLFAYCQTRAEAMGQALEMMLDIINEVRDNGITVEEMETARESIINSFVFGYDTPDKIVMAQAFFEFWGFPPDKLEKDLAGYQAVTLEDCHRVAKEYIKPENFAFIITGNKEIFDKPLEEFGSVTEVSLEIK